MQQCVATTASQNLSFIGLRVTPLLLVDFTHTILVCCAAYKHPRCTGCLRVTSGMEQEACCTIKLPEQPMVSITYVFCWTAAASQLAVEACAPTAAAAAGGVLLNSTMVRCRLQRSHNPVES